MCGIFGLITSKESNYEPSFLKTSFVDLALLSQSRGKDSSGICFLEDNNDSFTIFKGPLSVSQLIKNKKVKGSLIENLKAQNKVKFLIGHARLVTNGTQLNEENNQPVIKDDVIGVHNGIITNSDFIWENKKNLKKDYEIDTEIILSLLRDYLNKGNTLDEAIIKIFDQVEGSASIALVPQELNHLILATNNGSIYTLSNYKDFFIFASELKIIKSIFKKIKHKIPELIIKKIESNTGLIIDYEDLMIQDFQCKNKIASPIKIRSRNHHKVVNLFSVKSNLEQKEIVSDLNVIHLNRNAINEKSHLKYDLDKVDHIERCTKCILPVTFPFIYFDSTGVCNYCNNYNKKTIDNSLTSLSELVEKYRKFNSPDVLIPLSGGRDSIYTLHLVKEELKMNPISYTYDWGMVTDLARRNIARISGELGVENIIIAADIHRKRDNIKKNILAWLKNPSLGMIPIFMAGDKYFYYYAYKVKNDLDIDLEVWGINNLENTNFKTGFCGIKPRYKKKWNYSLSLADQFQLAYFFGYNYLKSPGYFNKSLLDTIGSFFSRYLTPKANHIQIFDYYKWNEKEVENTIISRYGWEKCFDTNSTWRIGDGTASFYNYIYCSVAGFTENDTFRSNQIRENMITREKALELIRDENKPRYNSLKWYLEILGLDFEDTIKRVNQIPKLEI